MGLPQRSLPAVHLSSTVAGLLLSAALVRGRLVTRPLAVRDLLGHPVLLVGSALRLLGQADVSSDAAV
jgi:hypothetical protein